MAPHSVLLRPPSVHMRWGHWTVCLSAPAEADTLPPRRRHTTTLSPRRDSATRAGCGCVTSPSPPPTNPSPAPFPATAPCRRPPAPRVTLAAAAAGHGPAVAGGNALAGVPPLASPAVALLPPPVAAASSSGALPAAGANRVVALLSGWPPRLWRTGVVAPGRAPLPVAGANTGARRTGRHFSSVFPGAR